MKKSLLLFSLTVLFSVTASPLGKFDEISGNWHVKTSRFSCTFLQGSMFPGEFVLSNGGTPGIILFRDTATDSTGKVYALWEERWADTRIIRNDEKTFIIERTGHFCRNSNPVITPLKSVGVTCRYEFQKDSPDIRIKFSYRKKADFSGKLNSGIHLVWYFCNPFDTILFKGKKHAFALPAGKKFHAWDAGGKIVLEGKKASVALQGKRVIAALSPVKKFPCSLNGGVWQHNWKQTNPIETEAVLTLKSK